MDDEQTGKTLTPITDVAGIQSTYSGQLVARNYVRQRFEAELSRLLHDRQVAVVDRVIKRASPTRVLEIAPGPGRITRHVNLAGVLVCLEYNEAMIEHGRPACGERALWVRSDGFKLPFGQMFGLVYSFRFVRHFQRKDRERLYGEVKRVLRPGGFFLMDAVNERVSKPLRIAHPEQYPIYDKLYDLDELREELTSAGLEPLDFVPVQKYYRWQHRSQVLLGPKANWINRFVIGALERLPRRDGLEWVVTCRRG